MRAANAVNISANAVHAEYVPFREFTSPLDLDLSFTRSCSEAVNFVVMNAGETILYENEIPERMRKNKYQIGFWVSLVPLLLFLSRLRSAQLIAHLIFSPSDAQ